MIPLSGIPRPDQVVDFARHRLLRLLGDDGATGRLGRAALSRFGRESGALTVEHAQLLRRLDRGQQVPFEELVAAVTRQLDAADRAFRAGRRPAYRTHLDRALRLYYHPSAHYGPAGSPLMLRAAEFMAPFRASAAACDLLLAKDPVPSDRSAALPINLVDSVDPARALRVLILCASSWTFIDRVREDLQQHTDAVVRSVDLSTLPLAERPTHAHVLQIREQWNRRRRLQPVPAELAEELRWADTVIVEWGNYPFAWVSLLDLSEFAVRLVARIHRFEVLTPYPLLARGAAFSEIAFVAPTARRVLSAVSPRLGQAGSLRDIQNVHHLEPFFDAADRPGARDRDRFRLLQIGWAPPIKGVEFSLEVIKRLREIDERYTLALVGSTLEESAAPHSAERNRSLRERIDALGDGVRELGFRTDIPDLLAGAGFLLSSSRAEGTHESVAEAAAAGCVPIVRNWPEMAPWGGAGMIYPQGWIVDDVEQAVREILALGDKAAWMSTAQERREWVRAHRDPEAIRADYLALLRG